jgi:hypothetical protein
MNKMAPPCDCAGWIAHLPGESWLVYGVAAALILILFVLWLRARRRLIPLPQQRPPAVLADPPHDVYIHAALSAAQYALNLTIAAPSPVIVSTQPNALADALTKLVSLLRDAAQSSAPATALFAQFCDHALDEPLAATSVVRGYFAEDAQWTSLCDALTLIETSLRVAMRFIDVEILLPLPMSVAVGHYEAEPRFDSRELRKVPELRRRAIHRARLLGRDEVLIVDRSVVGWTSQTRGSRLPTVVIFNPASWVTPQ